MDKYKKLTKDIVVFGAGAFLTKLVQFFLLPLYTYFLSTAAYGDGELLNNFLELVYPLSTLCLFEAVFRFALSKEFSDKTLLSCAMRELLIGLVIVTVGSFIVAAVSGMHLCALFPVLLACYCFQRLLGFYARGIGNTVGFAISGIVNAIGLGVSSVLFIVVIPLGAAGYVLALSFGYFVSTLYLLRNTHSFKMVVSLKNFDRAVFKEMTRYSWPLIGYNTALWISIMTGRYILAAFAGAAAAGLYLAVMKISAVVNMVQQVFFYAFQINASKEHDEGADLVFLSKTYWWFAAALIMVGSFLLCIIPLLADFLLQGEFRVGAIYLPAVLFAAIIDCLFCYFKSLYTAFKKTRRSLTSTIVGAAVNLVLCFSLIPIWDIWGAIMALLLTNIITGIIRAIDTHAFVRIDQRWRLNLPLLFLLTIQVAAYAFLESSATLINWSLFALIVVVLLLVYRDDLRMIFRAVRSRLSRKRI